MNIIYAIVETAIAALAICCFGWGAYHFELWWLLLLTIIPLVLYGNHTLIVDAELSAAEETLNQDGGDNDS